MFTFMVMSLVACGADSSSNIEGRSIEGLDIEQTFIPLVDARFIVILRKEEFETVSNPSSAGYRELLECANEFFDRMGEPPSRIPLVLYNITDDDEHMANDAARCLNCALGTACYSMDFQADASSKAFTKAIPGQSGARDFRGSCFEFTENFWLLSSVESSSNVTWFVPDYYYTPLGAPARYENDEEQFAIR
eukprot:GEMP01058106.1.p1 GENE.GEMP01058106.1~~GEMP01058106.1.p1  ORF type:complete len:201 (+),score=39.57 GEMP01058106.1:29-604(+)